MWHTLKNQNLTKLKKIKRGKTQKLKMLHNSKLRILPNKKNIYVTKLTNSNRENSQNVAKLNYSKCDKRKKKLKK